MRKKSLLVLILFFIIFLILFILFSQKFLGEMFIKDVKKAMSEELTVIDVTNLVTGEAIEHEHIYKTQYDESQHWEQCVICNKKQKVNKHSFTTTWAFGTESCHRNNSYTNTCLCGYSKILHKPCVWDGKSVCAYDDVRTHSKLCNICNEPIEHLYYLYNYGNGSIYKIDYGNLTDVRFSRQEVCHRADGTRISCQETGICIVCGTVYTESMKKHRPVGNMPGLEDKVSCAICKEILGIYNCKVSMSSEVPATVTVIMDFNLNNGFVFGGINSAPFGIASDMFQFSSQTVSNKNSDETVFTLTTVGKLKSNVKVSLSDPLDIWLKINGQIVSFGTGNLYTYKPDIIAPTISNISTNTNEWDKIKTIVVSGTENWTETVTVEISDDSENIIYTGNGKVTNKSYSISCVPEIESNTSGRNFRVKVIDACGNSFYKEFNIAKVDGVSPKITSIDKVYSEWQKEKQITLSAIDEGIGDVQIAFNDKNDYKLATKNGDSYSRNYVLVGDVYSPTTAMIMYKDGLGNTSVKELIIDKIDNFAPTILGASIHNNLLNINANDVKEALGEGSGVNKYRYITSTKKLENPVILDSGIEVNKDDKIIINDITNIKYVYVVAEDLVRKCE